MFVANNSFVLREGSPFVQCAAGRTAQPGARAAAAAADGGVNFFACARRKEHSPPLNQRDRAWRARGAQDLAPTNEPTESPGRAWLARFTIDLGLDAFPGIHPDTEQAFLRTRYAERLNA
jgi:hypothetical protein